MADLGVGGNALFRLELDERPERKRKIVKLHFPIEVLQFFSALFSIFPGKKEDQSVPRNTVVVSMKQSWKATPPPVKLHPFNCFCV